MQPAITAKVCLLSALICCTDGSAGLAATNSRESATIKIVAANPEIAAISVSVSNEIRAAVTRSLDWLAASQHGDGSWPRRHHPALTALPAMAFMKSDYPDKGPVISRAINYIASCARDDGGIYIEPRAGKKGGLEIFNTAVCATALHMHDKHAYRHIIKKARSFLAGRQHLGDDIYKGGFGYYEYSSKEYVHGLDTFFSMQAIAATGTDSPDSTSSNRLATIDWSETVNYFTKRQGNRLAPLPGAPEFAYSPGPDRAEGQPENVYFHSYGSMTYIGLLALVYADIDRSDVRVRSAFDWARKHWSLDENPGKDKKGLYFFYYVLTRALSAYGIDLIQTSNGDLVNWRADLAKKLLTLQRFNDEGNGFWKNDSDHFWENNPVLCSSYAILSLEMILPANASGKSQR